jgi:uncharacterized protein YcgL (UPF0745 family)
MRQVVVYRSSRVADLYLFVDQQVGLVHVPAPLLARFGKPIEVLQIELTAERKLARSDAPAVLEAIAERGYYLQLPPVVDSAGSTR